MRFFINTLPYCNTSTGIRVLHKLSNLIAQQGYESYTVEQNSGQQFVEDDDIVIYPTSFGNTNPLNARKIVRYILSPTNIDFGNDYIITFLESFYTLKPSYNLFIDTTESYFTNLGTERTDDALWIGKGKHCNRNLPITNGTILITYEYPKTRKELALFLNKIRTLYTLDNLTMLTQEALLCGCNVVYIDKDNNQSVVQPIEFPNKDTQQQQLISFLEDMKRL